MEINEYLSKLMSAEERAAIGLDGMSSSQREALFRWALQVFELGKSGQARVTDIDRIKYDGHLVILGDGSRWEVDELDSTEVSLWSEGDRVLVEDGKMYNLEELTPVEVEEEV